MICPNCKKETLKKITFHKNKVDICKECHGIWFDKDELRKAKDEKDQYLKWLDVDLWKEKKEFQASSSQKVCPLCKKNLYEIKYGKSNIKIDICNSCKGVWLDKGEFKKIIIYLENIVNTETLSQYFKDMLEEAKEIFTGPEELSSEIKDFFIVTKLLQYRFCVQYPIINDIILNLPFTK
ncbi:zf-TFIIB domain-containing protein [Candidatus Parcubacteria bacterium]|nr:zf-TFIIB domain-containing protein [Candidatus Parcubacteria bacterium]